MCFSATASFSVAAITGMVGLAALKNTKNPNELMIAAVPLLFAAQQAVEGFLWLHLSNGDSGADTFGLAFTFLIFAEVLWPIYPALAVLAIEPIPQRRMLVTGIAVIGGLLSAYLLVSLIGDPPVATIRGHSIAYRDEASPLSWRQVPYLICTCGPALLSSHRAIQAFGFVILLGFAVSAYAYFGVFVSVWCFFAAAGSTLLYFHFKRAAALAS